MRVFEIETPDGRHIRHRHPDIETARILLDPGFTVTGEVYGCDANLRGGLVDPIDGKSVLQVLLETRGNELVEWLVSRGFARTYGQHTIAEDATSDDVVTIPYTGGAPKRARK